MASSEHLASADFIKSVHKKLRTDSRIMGAEDAWQKHCEDEENLTKYASAMRNLATNHWESSYKKNTKAVSRVDWVLQFCQEYFEQEGIVKYTQREIEIAEKLQLDVSDSLLKVENRKYQLLDVGSCYNPFKEYPIFNVIPIDIAPASEDVYKCDFLNLELSCDSCDTENSEITKLQENSFDVIVFSLLLEYLPTSNQRHLCCEKAYNLLKPEGILIIITPDSKHVGANAKIMKSWRFILAKLGFSRIKYEKLSYLHCMVFRKSLKKEIAQRWALLQTEKPVYNEIVIPQDFNKSETVISSDKSEIEVSLFEELPQ